MASGARVGGYVLAGGRSSRMGVDKAFVELGGRSLVALAVEKLTRVTGSATILAGPASRQGSALGEFGPLVFDLHPGCGPLSGIEAALSSSECEWNLILPVDVPFLPAGLLDWWVQRTVGAGERGMRAAVFLAAGVVQPTVLLVHREMRQYVAEAIARGDYKVMRVLDEAALRLTGRAAGTVLRVDEMPEVGGGGDEWSGLWGRLSAREREAQALWFANVNTPEELAVARESAGALG